ncbi:chitosanase [Methanosarcina horonobensis]|uniref:chitosanase n=1 Tax=Methanosarcina horonobensis TaxID=418008 RepID=UPI000A737023|nr:chitosanase [Methanosarcina horonobensis]
MQKNALTKAFIYDMCVRHGVDGAERIIKNAGTTPKQGADENAYLQKLISLRDSKLKQEGLGDVNRDQGYKNVLNSGNVNLQTPFKFVAYGESFTIDGNLDLGEYQEETPVEDKPEEPEVIEPEEPEIEPEEPEIEPEEPEIEPEEPVVTPTEPEDKDQKDWDKHHKKYDNRRNDRHHKKYHKHGRC